MIDSVLRSNNDLALAGLKLQQARLAASMKDTNLTPNVDLSGSTSNSRYTSNGNPSTESYNTGINLSYELDLWGKLARQREQTQWQAEASEQERMATILTLIGTTSQLYWQIANANRQIANVGQSAHLAREILKFVQANEAAGSVGRLDLLQAQQTIFSRDNQFKSLKLQRAQNCNAVALLINRPPGQYFCDDNPLVLDTKVGIPATLPAEVIASRPDVKSAEMSLRSSLAGLDADRLSFYPTLSLTSSLSAGSNLFRNWFENPERTFGASIGLPFIQWNTLS